LRVDTPAGGYPYLNALIKLINPNTIRTEPDNGLEYLVRSPPSGADIMKTPTPSIIHQAKDPMKTPKVKPTDEQ
jgi:hypothetical protein